MCKTRNFIACSDKKKINENSYNVKKITHGGQIDSGHQPLALLLELLQPEVLVVVDERLLLQLPVGALVAGWALEPALPAALPVDARLVALFLLRALARVFRVLA